MVEKALGRLGDGMSEAADLLRNLLVSDEERIRLPAARTLLELGAKSRESVQLEERLAALEDQMTKGVSHEARRPTLAIGKEDRAEPQHW
jgi:hypothetical protein